MARTTEISESKIRQAIWMQKANKTKKAICEHLGIAYNTKRLDTVIQDFKDRVIRLKELKKNARSKDLNDFEKDIIIQSYQDGESQSAIANRLYLTSQRIKSILIENGVPIRSRKKRGQATVDHVIQDLDTKFSIGDKVFIPGINSFALIKEVYDEDWIHYYREPRRKRYVEFRSLTHARKKYGKDYEGREDVHWNIYWQYDNKKEWKQQAIMYRIQQVETVIEETGREEYSLYVEGEYGHWRNEQRKSLFPVRSSNT